MSHNITINQNTDSLSKIELDNLLLLYQKGMHKEATLLLDKYQINFLTTHLHLSY